LLQVWVDLQAAQALPSVPQAVSLVPAMQFPVLSQQPAQLDGPQGILLQAWLSHCSPSPQVWHSAPPLPQACLLVPARHSPCRQHPAQVLASHGLGRQSPAWQTSSAVQIRHSAPEAPHAASAVPGRHSSPSQQPLWQVCGPQLALSHWPSEHSSPEPQALQLSPP